MNQADEDKLFESLKQFVKVQIEAAKKDVKHAFSDLKEQDANDVAETFKNVLISQEMFRTKHDATATNHDEISANRIRIAGAISYARKVGKESGMLIAAELYDFMVPSKSAGKSRERTFVSIHYQIKEMSLTHLHDVTALELKIESAFLEYYSDATGKYVGPYFVFVQSSGMGKTKILHEYKKSKSLSLKSGSSDDPMQDGETQLAQPTVAIMMLCRTKKDEKEAEVFDHFLDLNSSNYKDFSTAKTYVFSMLDEIVKSMTASASVGPTVDAAPPPPRFVLLFDEAHYLLEKEHGLEAMLFRIVRLWLCFKRSYQSAAVFTGTTAKLADFRIKDDLDKELKTDTRDAWSKKDYYARGQETMEPFHTTTTIGCLRKLDKQDSSVLEKQTEYQKAVLYGRPLFAAMQMENDLSDENMKSIVKRMLLSRQDWQDDSTAWLSILATRVQMGQTTLETASDLVAGAYANAIGSSSESLKLCYMPDPVCARLAMCLMDEDWSMSIFDGEPNHVKGQCKKWWASKTKELYSKGLCSPEKGDLGEIMVALYCLMCGDILRKKVDSTYQTFSVDLDAWTGELVSKSGFPDDSDGEEEEQEKKRTKRETGKVEFSGVQVCRNFLRVYDTSWHCLVDESFLEIMYCSGVGYYVFAGCKTIDLVFALKITKADGSIQYAPMVVSVKAHAQFGPGAAKKECVSMEKKIPRQHKGAALCLLVVFGSSYRPTDFGKCGLTSSSCCEQDLLNGEKIAKILRVSDDDHFGLSRAFRDLTSMQEETMEVFASHSFLAAHSSSTGNMDVAAFASNALRARPKKKEPDFALEMVKELATQFGKIGVSESKDNIAIVAESDQVMAGSNILMDIDDEDSNGDTDEDMDDGGTAEDGYE